MPKIKVPSAGEKKEVAAPTAKRHVRLKNAFPPVPKERRLVAKARRMARERLASQEKAAPSFEEAFGASEDDVSLLCLPLRPSEGAVGSLV